jgi:chromatin remodeling complex protein RSC6
MRTAYVLEWLLYLDAKRATSKRLALCDAFLKPLLREPGKNLFGFFRLRQLIQQHEFGLEGRVCGA